MKEVTEVLWEEWSLCVVVGRLMSISVCRVSCVENSRELGELGREQAADGLLSGVTMEDGVNVLRVDGWMSVAVHISALPRTLSVARE